MNVNASWIKPALFQEIEEAELFCCIAVFGIIEGIKQIIKYIGSAATRDVVRICIQMYSTVTTTLTVSLHNMLVALTVAALKCVVRMLCVPYF